MSSNWVLFLLITLIYGFTVNCVQEDITSDHDSDLVYQLGAMKNTMKVLSDQWEKWNTLFITSLEPRITSTASTLSSIDSNIHNLQERAHVWDTFQLHVAAWNEQLSSMDRKIDILNKAVEQLTVLDSKMNTILSDEYKLDKLIKMSNSLMEAVLNIENSVKTKELYCKSSKSSLFEEFAVRGILSSLKLVERKVDRLLGTSKLTFDNSKPEPTNNVNNNKLYISKTTENLVSDIASKVDIIFDTISKNNENDYSDDYLDVKTDTEGSGNSPAPKLLKQLQPNGVCRSADQNIKEVLLKLGKIESRNSSITRSEVVDLLKQFSKAISINHTKNLNMVLDGYFHEDRSQWSSILNSISEKCMPVSKIPPLTSTSKPTSESPTLVHDHTTSRLSFATVITSEAPTTPKIANQTSCNDLSQDSKSDIYIFKVGPQDFINERFFNKKYCESRPDGLWTVIQRRDNYSIQQDFNVTWYDYKLGFGDLNRDFWIGNNYLSRLSKSDDLKLRIELEDFDGHAVWAEYDEFKIAGEDEQFKLTVRIYSGNASDAFSSHSGARFSTYDKKNDEAPACCPCSVSYGGGWWFNRCFESNLNGVYYKKPFINEYFRGVIWEHWLGNYSLKKSLMMVKSKGTSQFYGGVSNVTHIEDP